MIRLWTGQPQSSILNPGRIKRFFFLPKHPEKVWSPHSLAFKNNRWFISQETNRLQLAYDHYHSFCAEVKNAWSFISNTFLQGVHRNNVILLFLTLLSTTDSHVVGCAIIIIVLTDHVDVVAVIGS
jgi:hypothetical protein